MTKDEAIEALSKIETDDREDAHGRADAVLLRFLESNGFSDVSKAWESLCDRCGGFWYA